MKFHQLFLSLFVVINSVDAYPTGAGQCIAGDMAPGGPHVGNLKGSLEDGSLQFTVDGSPPTTDDVITGGMAHTLKIEGLNGGTFRGFLIRMSAVDLADAPVSVSGTLSEPADNAIFQILESTGEAFGQPATCAPDVAGATHTNRDDKMSVEVTFTLPTDTSVDDLVAEVTVMVLFDEYYYSKYELDIKDDDDAGGPTPSTSPGEPTPTQAPGGTPAPTSNAPNGLHAHFIFGSSLLAGIATALSW